MAPSLKIFTIICLAAGATAHLYLYHVRPRRFPVNDRKRILSWPLYGLVDVYLKVSTLAVTVLALWFDHLLLAELFSATWLLLAGLLVAGVSLLLFAAAMLHLDTNYSPAHASHLPERIICSGPYRYIRHPVYTANLLLLTGLFLISGSAWIVLNLIILVSYYVPVIHREEAALKADLPGYRDYTQRTGRFLPPLVRGGARRD